ncbi:MAG TPA: transcriptional regulator NrdR [Bacteriovoracaceae bacterium]|nr:transcriptional regulator NrdR [Bacteriovoracaceae bacterium]
MRCPLCGYGDTRVLDSRPVEGGVTLRRRRNCGECDGRFTTHERVVMAPIFVQKKDGRREEFQIDKLRNGISKACNKRPVSVDAIHSIIAEVESALRQEGKSEVDSFVIGEMVMERLYHLDQVAYVRFASVYHRFDDVKRFAQLLERISRRPKRKGEVRGNQGTLANGTTPAVPGPVTDEQLPIEPCFPQKHDIAE